jgi:hypothetical protein
MNQNTFSVHFTLRSGSVDEEGYAPIYAKITLNEKPLLLTLNHKIKMQDWNTKKDLPLPRAANVSIINDAIQALQTRIYKAHAKLTATTEAFTLAMLKDEIVGKPIDREKVHILIETIEEYNKNFSGLIGIKYSEGSYKKYRSSLKNARKVPQRAVERGMIRSGKPLYVR